MSFTALRVVFHLDGSGICMDPHEPIMLDGLLAAVCARHHVHGEAPARDEIPDDIPLPLARWHCGEQWGWRASALFPDGDVLDTVTYWRKRLRQSRIDVTTGSPNTENGVYRDWNMPLPLMLCRRLVAYAVGDRKEVRHELIRSVRYLGRKRAHGHGRVVRIDVEKVDVDWSIVRDGRMMRWMPHPDGTRFVRPRPPYWSSIGRVPCVEIGAAAPAVLCR